jgi:hypothetical protein
VGRLEVVGAGVVAVCRLAGRRREAEAGRVAGANFVARLRLTARPTAGRRIAGPEFEG